MPRRNTKYYYDKKTNRIVTNNQFKKKLINDEETELEKRQVLTVKEKNRKRYENRQKRNSFNATTKKKILNVEIDNTQTAVDIKKEPLNEKKEKKIPLLVQKFKEKIKPKKDILPLEENKQTSKQRLKIYFKEAFYYSLIITIINILSYFIIDEIHLLRLFDIYILNVILSIILSLLLNYIIAFFIDSLLSELWVKHQNKKVGV